MAQHGKKYRQAHTKIDRAELYSYKEGVAKVKELAFAKFDESIDVHVNVGIDPTKGDQVVRSSVVLPHGNGRSIKIAVFAKGDYADAALKAGADYVGAEDLIERIEAGWMDFNYAVATPDIMGLVGRVAKILGPRGLLPNKKIGTVSFEVDQVIKDLKRGRLFFKNDKTGIVHFSIGRVSFDAQKLQENLIAFMRALAAAKPPSSKGKFIRRVAISSTMGIGIHLNAEEA